uniref:Copia protein n=1 Tax=Tanacetum cinerariifolium TaxID=118510 RepID=A0A699GMY4_TANCI|nr:copia protein [Tanacetum cinerariifolium]
MFDEYFNPPTIVVSLVLEAAAPRAKVLANSPVSISISQDAPSTSIPSSQAQEHSPIISYGFKGSPKTPTFHDDPPNESPQDSPSQGSSSNAKPTEKHLQAVKRIFRYLKGTINIGLWYSKDTNLSLTAYADADHAGCQDTRRSTSGSAQFLGDKLVNWSSKKQKRTAISTKHIYVRYHFIKEQVENGIVELYFARTKYQLSVIFTKPFPRVRFNFLIDKLGMKSMSPDTLKRLAEETDPSTVGTFAALINRSLSGKTTAFDKLCISRADILWAMYYQKNVDYVELLWEDFTYQIDNCGYKKQEKMKVKLTRLILAMLHVPYLPRLPGNLRKCLHPRKIVSHYQQMKNLSRKAKELRDLPRNLPKKSLTTLTTCIIIREPLVETQSKRKENVDVAHGKVIDLLSEVAMTEEAQMKEVRKKSLRDFHKSHPSSSGTKSQPKSSGKSVHMEEPKFEVGDTDTPQGQEGNQGNDNDEPRTESASRRGNYPFDLSKPLPLITHGNRQSVPVEFFINNDFKYLQGGILTMTYTTSTTKTKATQYALPDIKDMRNRLMCSDELYKFSDGTLTRLLSSLEDITKNIDMEYLPKRRWSTLEKKRAHCMIKDINKLLKERRMMRSLEKFVGGRLYGTDLRLLQRTI